MNKKYLITGGSGFIGTHLIELILENENDSSILNIDINKPILESHVQYWSEINIMDKLNVEKTVLLFKPDFAIHLAANASVEYKKMSDYRVNLEGTSNFLSAVKNSPNLIHTIITSTQAVCRPGYLPLSDIDFYPNTIYGESKSKMEMLVRNCKLPGTCTIVRPTYVWGPYHPKNANDLFYAIKKRYYLYPGKRPIIRSYGYVKNVVWQIYQLLSHENNVVDTYYVGDMPINYYNWVQSFSLKMTGRNVRTIPIPILKALSLFGDVISQITSKGFLINSYRYTNMTESNPTPMKKIFDLLGYPPHEFENNVNETVNWLSKIWSKK